MNDNNCIRWKIEEVEKFVCGTGIRFACNAHIHHLPHLPIELDRTLKFYSKLSWLDLIQTEVQPKQ